MGVNVRGAQVVTTTGYDMVAAAKALRPQIIAARDEMDRNRRLPSSLVSAMDEAGLFRTYMPKSLGGYELDPVTAFQVIEEVAKADGSAGWCCFIAGSLSLFTGWLEIPVAREMFGTPPTLRGAGSFRPLGTARMVDGGYVANGQWDFASGCLHANWLALNCVVTDDSGPRMNVGGPLDGTPQLRMMSVPMEDARVVDNWSVIGLARHRQQRRGRIRPVRARRTALLPSPTSPSTPRRCSPSAQLWPPPSLRWPGIRWAWRGARWTPSWSWRERKAPP